MNSIKCPRCQNLFYSVLSWPEFNCPFCGYTFKPADSERRTQRRAIINKDCNLLKGERNVRAQTVDISKTGLGIKMMGSMPFDVDETVKVVVRDFEIESSARLVWVRRFDGVVSRAGLKFC